MVAVLAVVGIIGIAIAAFWDWDWFIPIVETRASAALGRKVEIRHLSVGIARDRLEPALFVRLEDLRIANPDGFDGDFAQIGQVRAVFGLSGLLPGSQLSIPSIALEHPNINLLAHSDGQNNWTLGTRPPAARPTRRAKPPRLGEISVTNGHVHVSDPKVRAIFDLNVYTRQARNTGREDAGRGDAGRGDAGRDGRIEVDAKGTYANQPITGHFSGGAILSVRSASRPYPVDLEIRNGATSASVHGSVQQPLALRGAKLTLEIEGPDMALLLPLTGVPIPQTPPYRVSGKLDYRHDRVVLDDISGKLGSSDIAGTITVLAGAKPDVTAALTSRYVDLGDLGGFFGGAPNTRSAATKQPNTAHPDIKAATRPRTDARPAGDVLPEQPISLPRLNAANVHLRYDGAHIVGRHVPLDNIVARVDVIDGGIYLHELNFAVGSGTVATHGTIVPQQGQLKASYQADFQNVDLSRLLRATAAFSGQGVITGRAAIATNGNSIASMLAHGDGGIALRMSNGGNVSALLSDIAGLEFGNALLSALGLPQRTDVKCFLADLPLQDGILATRTLLLQTGEARTVGNGTVNLRDQTIDYTLTTRSTHLSIGSLPGPVTITGKLGAPHIRPGAEVAARAGVAAGLGVLMPPLAALPTIQLGVGESDACRTAMENKPAAEPAPAQKPIRHIRPGEKR